MVNIFIACHKETHLPQSDALVPIQVGHAISDVNLNMLGDDTGENISAKNKYFCELTAIYWMWKNSTADIVGLCHYRRYFNLSNKISKIKKIPPRFTEKFKLNSERIHNLMNDCDIILPIKLKHDKTLYDFYKQKHIARDIDLTLEIIKEKYPQEYQTVYDVWHKYSSGYYNNMFITSKKVFDDYASWMFDILFELEKRIQKDVLTREPYQQRVYGFISERLMTCYIALHPELKVKEMPVIFVSEIYQAKKFYLLGIPLFSIKHKKDGKILIKILGIPLPKFKYWKKRNG